MSKNKNESLRVLPLTQITVHAARNPRGTDWGGEDDEAFQQLKESILDTQKKGMPHGLLQPVVVRETSKGEFTLVSGYRRFRALTEINAGYKSGARHWSGKIPVTVLTTDESDEEQAETTDLSLALIENLQRTDMSAIATARALKSLLDGGMSTGEIAKHIRKTPGFVSQYTSLLSIDEAALQVAEENEAPISILREATRLKNLHHEQHALLTAYGDGELTVADAKERVKDTLRKAEKYGSDELGRVLVPETTEVAEPETSSSTLNRRRTPAEAIKELERKEKEALEKAKNKKETDVPKIAPSGQILSAKEARLRKKASAEQGEDTDAAEAPSTDKTPADDADVETVMLTRRQAVEKLRPHRATLARAARVTLQEWDKHMRGGESIFDKIDDEIAFSDALRTLIAT